jgi:uncharacterized protein
MLKELLRTPQDIEDFTRGTDFMSASGGGSPRETRERLLEDLKAGHQLGWTDLSDLRDDAHIVCTSFAGSVAPESFDRGSMEDRLGVRLTIQRPLVAAVRELEAHMGLTFDAMIASEIGGINTGLTLDAAANLGKPIVDADYAGRAVPESTCNTPFMAGKNVAPRACVTYYGDRVIIKSTANNNMTERISKHVAMAGLGVVGCAGIPLTGREVKQIAVAGTLTRSLSIGRVIREARQQGGDPLEALVRKVPETWLVFRGKIATRTYENRDGYMWGEHEIEGAERFSGHRLRLWFKNENHVSWLDGRPHISSPDVLEVVDGRTAEPLANTYLEVGQYVGVIGVKRCAQFDSPEGIRVLGPRRWDFDLDFVPIEQLVE